MWEFGRTRFRALGTDVPSAADLAVYTNVYWATAPGNGPPLSC